MTRMSPVFSATAEAQNRILFPTAFLNTLSIPARLNSEGQKSRRFYSPAITAKFPAGDAGSNCEGPGKDAPIYFLLVGHFINNYARQFGFRFHFGTTFIS